MVAHLRRAFVAGWIGLAVLGALDQTIFPSLFGAKLELGLPQLKYGHDMFHENLRRVRVGHYARADGVEHDLADLVETPSLGYKRSRTELNLLASAAYVRELCRRALRSPDDELTITVDEYEVDRDPRRPSTSFQLRCDAHGVQPR